MPLRVAFEQTPGALQSGFMMQAGKDVEQLALRRLGIACPIGGDQRHLQAAPQLDHGLITRFLVAIEVALEFQISAVLSKDAA